MYSTIRRRARTGRKHKRLVFTVDVIERKFRVRFVSHNLIDKKKIWLKYNTLFPKTGYFKLVEKPGIFFFFSL